MLAASALLSRKMNVPAGMELVLTGRGAPPAFLDVADLVTEIGIMVHATEKNLVAARTGLDRETVLDLEEALGRARAAARAPDLAALQKARDELERATLPLAALLMDSVAKKALAGKSLGEV